MTEKEEGALFFVWMFIDSTLLYDEYYPADTYYSLIEKGYIKESVDKYQYLLTELGESYVESILPQDLVVKIIALPHTIRWRVIAELVEKVSLEGLPVLLVHEEPDVRLLARNRFEELRDGTK